MVLSSYDAEITGGSPIRTHTTDMIPQLDGPTSVHTRGRILENARIEQETIQRTTVIPRGGFLMRVIAILMIKGDIMMDEGPLEEEGIKIGVEGCQIEGIIMIEVTVEEERPPDDGGPPDNGGPPDDGGPLRNG